VPVWASVFAIVDLRFRFAYVGYFLLGLKSKLHKSLLAVVICTCMNLFVQILLVFLCCCRIMTLFPVNASTELPTATCLGSV